MSQQSLPFSPDEFRWLQLQQQGLLKKVAANQTAVVVQALGYVQIDSIHVVQRAHHHVLFNRVRDYQPARLDRLMAEKQIFEYWSHAAAYLPIEDFRYSLHKKQQLAAGKKHWFERDDAQMQFVRQRIRDEGPLKAADFEKSGSKSGPWWDWQPHKKALEQLFMQGELMVVGRDKFQKVFDLTERVMPTAQDWTAPTDQEMAAHLIERYLKSHGFGSTAQISYLRAGLKSALQQELHKQCEEGRLHAFVYGKQTYYMPHDLDLPPRKPHKVHLLNPFDNLVIQRQRLADWFGFDYQIEVYVPAEKRKIGYYSLPILFGADFVGQVDVKADRSRGVLLLQHLSLHDSVRLSDKLARELAVALTDYAKFNGCTGIELVQATQAVRAWFDAAVATSLADSLEQHN
ncbi:MAG TPA: hypothetical protein DCS87_12700 [Rheinheimera sp.]|nr:hypothetical protein [Rheinheimera sp.]